MKLSFTAHSREASGYLPRQWHFYWHGDDLSQQAAVESRHERSGVVIGEDQRHLQVGGERTAALKS